VELAADIYAEFPTNGTDLLRPH